MEQIDLIDDIWLQVFNYFGLDRARLAIVCKRWAAVILHPRHWRTFEADFSSRKRGFGDRRIPIDAIEPFIAKYCTNLVDCHLTAETFRSVPSLFNTLLQIKTLRRLAICTESSGFGRSQIAIEASQLVEPQCKDLVLLHLKSVILKPDALQALLLDLPNLEELYLSQPFVSAEVFEPAQKLRQLSFNNDVLASIAEVQRLSEMLPSLRYVVYSPQRVFGSPTPDNITTVGNVTLIPITALQSSDMSKLQQLGTFISPANQPQFLLRALESRRSKECIRYLVTERKYDVNYTKKGKFFYTVEAPVYQIYPLQAAVGGLQNLLKSNQPTVNDYLDVVEELLKLGADPNSPFSYDSPLASCTDADTFLMLLKYGADPNKLVAGQPAAWSIFNNKFLEPERVLQELIGVMDVNAKYGPEEYTMLMNAVNERHGRSSLVNMLLEAGAQWTPRALNALHHSMPQLFEDFVHKGKADLSLLNTPNVFKSLERGMLAAFRDHLRTLTSDEEEPKLSPMHYAALTLIQETECGQDLQPREREKFAKRWSVAEETALLFEPSLTRKAEKDKKRRHIGKHLASQKQDDAPIQANTNTGGFGSTQAPTPLGTPSTFGASTTSGFGTPSTFGASTTSGFGTPSTFGTSTTSGFGSTTTKSSLEPKPFFGSSTTNSSMGGPAPIQANTNTGGFGTSQASTPVGTSSTFGTSTTSGFGMPSTFGTSTTSGFSSTTTGSSLEPKPFFFSSATSSSMGANNSPSPNVGTTTTSLRFGMAPTSGPAPIQANTNTGSFGTSQAPPSLGTSTTSGFGTPSTFGTSTTSGFGPTTTFGASTTSGLGIPSTFVRPRYVTSKLESIDEVIPLLNCSINEKTSDGATPLLLLCMSVSHSSEAKVKNATSLIKHGANVDLADKHDWTPLHAALYVGDWSLASLLLEHGADINAQDTKGITPLMALIYGFRHIEQLGFDDFESEWSKLVTSFNVDLTLVDRSFNRSLVHLMAAVGSPAMFECVEEKLQGLDLLNAKDIEGFTPLHYAVMFDNIETVHYLLDHGADANAQTTSLKLTPAMVLCNIVPTEITAYLAHYNTLLLGQFSTHLLAADYDRKLIKPPWVRSVPRDFMEKEKMLNFDTMMKALVLQSNPAVLDDDGNTILHHLVGLIEHLMACSVSNPSSVATNVLEVIRTTNAFKSYWTKPNFKNRTPANRFIRGICLLGGNALKWRMEILQVIKDQEIDLNHEGTHASAQLLLSSLPPSLKLELLALIDHSRTNYVSQVLEPRKGNPLFDLLQNTAYDVALVKTVLLAYPNAINSTDQTGATPLIFYVVGLLQRGSFIASLHEILPVIDVLLATQGVDLDAQDQDGNTALHYACKYFHTGFIDAIDANLNIVGLAVTYCLFAFKLIEAGARTDLKNKRGQTPLDYAPKLMEHYEKVYPIVKAVKLKEEQKPLYKKEGKHGW